MTPVGAVSHPSTAEAATTPVLQHDLGTASWRALGTYVELRTAPDALERAADLVADVLAEVDRACSRFRADSDLTRANAAAGPVTVSPVLVAAVRVALEAADETAGLVDPTLGAVLVSAGYDCTFSRVPADDRGPGPRPVPASLPPRRVGDARWADVVVTDTTVAVPEGAWLDLGATGKAFAADLAALAVEEALGVAVVVGVGGDLRVAGGAPGGSSYDVVVGDTLADLEAGAVQTHLTLREGGLATSSTSARRWRRAGRQWHHLVDPRTGGPASGCWRTVTALGRTAAAANTASTAAVVLGDEAQGWLTDRDVAARLVDHAGAVTRTPAWVASGVEQPVASGPGSPGGRPS